jgi:hypothetical protein
MKFHYRLKRLTILNWDSFTLSIPAYTLLKTFFFKKKITKNISSHIHSLVNFTAITSLNLGYARRKFPARHVPSLWRCAKFFWSDNNWIYWPERTSYHIDTDVQCIQQDTSSKVFYQNSVVCLHCSNTNYYTPLCI